MRPPQEQVAQRCEIGSLPCGQVRVDRNDGDRVAVCHLPEHLEEQLEGFFLRLLEGPECWSARARSCEGTSEP